MNRFFCKVLAGLLVLVCTQGALAEPEFVIRNQCGVDIHSIWIGDTEGDEWGADLLDEDEVLADQEELGITFSVDSSIEDYDIRIEDGEGNFVEFTGVELEGADAILLNEDGTAEPVILEE